MPDDRDPEAQLADARKAIERDAAHLRRRWHRARDEAAEGLGRLTWVGQIGSWVLRMRGWSRGPGRPD